MSFTKICVELKDVSFTSDFHKEKMLIPQKLDYVGYPSPFMNSVIREYQHK